MHTVSQKKCQFCQYYTLLWAKKVNSMPLFSEFSRKNYCSYGHTLSKTCILSPANSSNVHILLKMYILSKHGALMSFFFKIFHTKPQLSRPYLVENVSSAKTTLFYGPKKSIRCPFFSIFKE